MLSIFSCASWPSIRLLWKNVYLDLPIFQLDCFVVVVELYELFIYFGNWALVGCIICIFLLPFHRLHFHFMVSFVIQKLVSLITSYLFWVLFLLPWENDLRKHWYNLCQRMFGLYSLLGVLWYHVLYLSLCHFEFIFVFGKRVCSDLVGLHATVQLCQHHLLKRLFPIVCSYLLCKRLIELGEWVYFWTLFCSIDPYTCFCISTTEF